jgi:hypothetical protein
VIVDRDDEGLVVSGEGDTLVEGVGLVGVYGVL